MATFDLRWRFGKRSRLWIAVVENVRGRSFVAYGADKDQARENLRMVLKGPGFGYKLVTFNETTEAN